MTTNTKVLLVDDEPAITSALATFLERADFTVAVAGDGDEALDLVTRFRPDMIVLDILMPRMNGREVLRQLRRRGDWTPVIMLTQVTEVAERSMALDEGADDYLNKPFYPQELASRIRAVLRRSRPGRASLDSAATLASGGLLLDRRSRRVYLDQQEVALTPKAVTILEYLMLHPDELLTRDQILEKVWGWGYMDSPRAVDMRIAELRKGLQDDKPEPRFIETVRGQGYRFVGIVEAGQ